MPGKAGSGSIGILYRPFILLSHTRYKRHRIVYERSDWSQQGFAAVVAYLALAGRMGRLRAIQCNSFSDVILTHPAMLDLSNPL
jgi:hypothetical protein